MTFNNQIFYSKIARRIFLIFVGCALLPVIVLTLISFNQVTTSLKDQAIRRLRHMTKSEGMAIYDRLLLLDTNLKIIAADYDPHRLDTSVAFVNEDQAKLFGRWATGIVHVAANGEIRPVFKNIEQLPQFSKSASSRKVAGKSEIFSVKQGSLARIFMLQKIADKKPGAGALIMEVNTAFLWGIGAINTVPQQTRLCVLNQATEVLLSPFGEDEDVVKKIRSKLAANTTRYFEFDYDTTQFLASYWSIFLPSNFNTPNWTVILSQDKSDVLGPLDNFKHVFPLVILVSILTVLLLSIIYIRKSLVPLEKLKEGTERIAKRDFSGLVDIKSDDEFAELAMSFNSMTGQLRRQFKALDVIGEIDRAILSSLGTSAIVDRMMARVNDLMECETVCIALFKKENSNNLVYFIHDRKEGRKSLNQKLKLSDEHLKSLQTGELIFIDAGDELPDYLNVLKEDSAQSMMVIPLIVKDRVAGLFAFGFSGKTVVGKNDEISHARHLANQMSVALANSFLVEELEGFSWGAIEALGRTVDAKSPWTAGHSERVTNYALQIANAISLPEERLKKLHRAALLHDIGKIGVSMEILDKPGRLTDEEYEHIKGHPSIGAKILEPIAAFKEIIPIIVQHHESYDGKGYPQGLKAADILLEARILTVADVFDALISVRPYRKEWSQEKIVDYLQANAGKKFDPAIVSVFLNLLNQDAVKINPLKLY